MIEIEWHPSTQIAELHYRPDYNSPVFPGNRTIITRTICKKDLKALISKLQRELDMWEEHS